VRRLSDDSSANQGQRISCVADAALTEEQSGLLANRRTVPLILDAKSLPLIHKVTRLSQRANYSCSSSSKHQLILQIETTYEV